MQEQKTAHIALQKKLRTPNVQSCFDESAENKSWHVLKGAYFPALAVAATSTKTQIQQLQAQIREFGGIVSSAVGTQSSLISIGGAQSPLGRTASSSFQEKTALVNSALSTQVSNDFELLPNFDILGFLFIH